MARVRSPNRDKAFEIYKEHGGDITNRVIATMLNEDEKVIAVWKSRDKWNVVHQSSERCTTNEVKHNKAKKKAVADEVKSVMSNDDLTDKQRLFCIYYSKSFNATQSYKKAYGCSYEVALTEGPTLKNNPRISSEIKRLKQIKLSDAYLEPGDIFQKYMDIAFSDITDYLSFGQEEVPVMGAFGPVMDKETDKPLTKIVNTVKFRESSDVDGTIISEVKQGKDGASIRLGDRMKALDWLTYHMDMATAEQRARIAQIKAQTDKLKGNDDDTEKTGLGMLDETLKTVKELMADADQ